MNLRAIANRATSTVNPNVTATLRASDGYETSPAGKPVPMYRAPEQLTVQMQSLSKRDLQHLAEMNISDATRAVFANRQMTGVDRRDQSGGDLLDLPDGTFLVTAVLEDWTPTAGWCKVAVTRQL